MLLMQLPKIEATDPFLSIADALSMGLFFVSTSFSLLLFILFTMRTVKTKRLYWVYFAGLMFCISIGRIFYIIYDFLMPYFSDVIEKDQLFPLTIYKMATTFQFIASGCLVGFLTILMFPEEDNKVKKALRIILPLIPVSLVIVLNVLPPEYLVNINYPFYSINEQYDNLPIVNGAPIEIIPEPTGFFKGYPVGLFVMIYILMPILNFLVPLLFFFLGRKTFGAIKRSSYMNGLGCLIYYTGRTLQTVVSMVAISPIIQALLPPIVIIIGLAIIASGNLSESMIAAQS